MTHFPIGQQIAELRQALCLTTRQVASRADMSITYISFIENGKPPTPQQLDKIQAALGVRLDDPRAQQLFDLLSQLRKAANGH